MDDLVFEEVDAPAPPPAVAQPRPVPTAPIPSSSKDTGMANELGRRKVGTEGGTRPAKRAKTTDSVSSSSSAVTARPTDPPPRSSRPHELVLPQSSLPITTKASSPASDLPPTEPGLPSPPLTSNSTSSNGFAAFADRPASFAPTAPSSSHTAKAVVDGEARLAQPKSDARRHAPLFGSSSRSAIAGEANHLGRIPIIGGSHFPALVRSASPLSIELNGEHDREQTVHDLAKALKKRHRPPDGTNSDASRPDKKGKNKAVDADEDVAMADSQQQDGGSDGSDDVQITGVSPGTAPSKLNSIDLTTADDPAARPYPFARAQQGLYAQQRANQRPYGFPLALAGSLPHPYSSMSRQHATSASALANGSSSSAHAIRGGPPFAPLGVPPGAAFPPKPPTTWPPSRSSSQPSSSGGATPPIPLPPHHQLSGPPSFPNRPTPPPLPPIPSDAPVCIGLLSSLVLILFPVKEFEGPPKMHPNGGGIAPQTLPVTLMRAPPSNKSETIKVISRTGEQFGVVEHRVANVLGPYVGPFNSLSGTGQAGGWINPLLRPQGIATPPLGTEEVKDDSDDDDLMETEGLGGRKKPVPPTSRHDRQVYLEACVVRRGEQNPLMLPLQLLLFCVPSAIPQVSAALMQAHVILEHPISYDAHLHAGCRYGNPHTPQQRQAEQDALRRRLMGGYIGAGGSGLGFGMGGFGGPRGQTAAMKSVDVQREQVDEVFKSLRSGVDLIEVDAPAEVVTPLYPHQRQALAFMLDRESLKEVDDNGIKGASGEVDKEENLVSLWKQKKDTYGRLVGWVNVVTEVEKTGKQPPPQCRSSILADDMGLGKTISIIALLVKTRHQALQFENLPPSTTREQAAFDAVGLHGADDPVTLQNFANAFNMPSISGATSGRGGKKKQSKTQKKRIEAETERLSMLKVRSRATLIVCPLSTVQNWESQIDEHVQHKDGAAAQLKAGNVAEGAAAGVATSLLSVYVYHGNNRLTDIEALANHDVVITTYSLLGSEYSRQNRGKEDKEGKDGNDSSDGIEEVDAEGNPLSGTTTPREGKPGAKPGAKRKRKADGTPSPLQSIQWFRVVLDEAHMIKDHTTIQARAAGDLAAERRVCLTGTPLQNSLNDLFSLIRFLRLEPFTDRGLWTAHIGAPAKLGDPLGVSRLQLIMRHLALRRTKNSKDKDGNPILSLPIKRENMVLLDLDQRELAFYRQHYQRSKKTFITLEKTDSLLKNYCSILQELLRLRQICAHMALVADGEDARAGGGTEDLLESIRKNGITKPRAIQLLALMRDTGAAQCAECGVECVSTNMAMEREDIEEEVKKPAKRGRKKAVVAENDDSVPPGVRAIVTRCQHLFCLDCFRSQICEGWPTKATSSERSICTACREEITPVLDAIEVLPSELEAFAADAVNADAAVKKGKSDRVVEHSTKIRTLLLDLLPFSQANPASANYVPDDLDQPTDQPDGEADFKAVKGTIVKSVVFSQWTKLLDRIGDALDECNIVYGRLDGTMNRLERSRSMDNFRLDPRCEVLLVSLRAGGVGLNLTAAQRVYVMEPFWNPAVENQAVDRVHRLGQTRPVQTIRYIIKGSIEQNMLEIQKRKTDLANMSLGQTLSKAELAKRRVEDLQTLFKDSAGASAAPSGAATPVPEASDGQANDEGDKIVELE